MTIELLFEQLRAGSADAREIPLPNASATSTSAYRSVPVAKALLSDPLAPVSSVGIDAESYFGVTSAASDFYRTSFAEAEPLVLLRQSALPSLAEADQLLRNKYGCHLFGIDGYRSLACQQAIRRFFVESSRTALTGRGCSDEEIENFADRLCSRPAKEILPNDPTTWHAHVTGGAFDTLLRASDGSAVQFGAQLDRHGPELATDYYEAASPDDSVACEARANRRLLFWIMAAFGWINYPREYWHFDICSDSMITQFAISNRSAWSLDIAIAQNVANLGPARV